MLVDLELVVLADATDKLGHDFAGALHVRSMKESFIDTGDLPSAVCAAKMGVATDGHGVRSPVSLRRRGGK